MNANDICQLNLMNGKETLWIDRGWRASDKDPRLIETKLLNNHEGLSELGAVDYAEVDPHTLTTFHQKEHEIPAPYATTTLIGSGLRRDNTVSLAA